MTDDPYAPETYLYSPMAGYVVLSGDRASLAIQVRNHMVGGWVCQGGVAVFGEPGNARMYQAMTHPYVQPKSTIQG
jgi:hypothetical protein